MRARLRGDEPEIGEHLVQPWRKEVSLRVWYHGLGGGREGHGRLTRERAFARDCGLEFGAIAARLEGELATKLDRLRKRDWERLRDHIV